MLNWLDFTVLNPSLNSAVAVDGDLCFHFRVMLLLEDERLGIRGCN